MAVVIALYESTISHRGMNTQLRYKIQLVGTHEFDTITHIRFINCTPCKARSVRVQGLVFGNCLDTHHKIHPEI